MPTSPWRRQQALIVPLLPPIPDYNEQEHQSKDEVFECMRYWWMYEIMMIGSKMSVAEATAINWRK
jgi:hypothetical protein